jgi:hypothetical protein
MAQARKAVAKSELLIVIILIISLVREDDDKLEFDIVGATEVKVYPTFEAMGLRDELLRGIYNYGKSFHL